MNKRILIKISGEALLTDIKNLANYEELEYLEKHPLLSKISGFGVASRTMLLKIALDLKEAQGLGTQLALVIGGGNICRGSQESGATKSRAEIDKIGMLSTIINGFILGLALNRVDLETVVLSTRSMPSVCELYTPFRAEQYLKAGKIVICAGGSGQPFFTTDTAAVIRACELGCNALFKGTKVKGIYDIDPGKNPSARFLPKITYDDFLAQHIKIMDSTAISIAKDQNLPIEIFCIYRDQAFSNAIKGSLEKSVII